MGGTGGCIPKNFTVGDGYIAIPQYGWLTGHNRHTYESYVCLSCIDKTAPCVLLRTQRDMYAFSIFSPYNISFTSISKINISLGVRPLHPLLDLRPWTPLGEFCAPGYLPLCVNPSPKVTEPLTPLGLS